MTVSRFALAAALLLGACSASPSGDPGEGSVGLTGTATEQALCAALDGNPNRLPPLIDAVANDAESGVSLSLDGALLELHLTMTNNERKVQEDIDSMKSDCNEQAG
jgi:hypothetical protein